MVQVAADQLANMESLRDRLIEGVSAIKGASVEDNIFSVSVHYRNCHPGDVQQVRLANNTSWTKGHDALLCAHCTP